MRTNNPEFDSAPIIGPEATKRAAERTVRNAFDTDFSVDPVVGPEFSKSYFVIGSCVQRHGALIQRTIADVLTATGRFEGFTDMPVVIPVAADELLASRNSKENLAKIKVRSGSDSARTVVVALVVVERETGFAGAYDVKRGGGMTDSRRRAQTEHDMFAIRMVLASHLAKSGFDIGRVTTGVIDYLGASGFNGELKISRAELDDHFGTEIVATVDALTAALKGALHARLRSLIEQALDKLPGVSATVGPQPTASDNVTSILRTRPVGPGPRRTAGNAS
jgi:hypothetical protein